MTPHNISPEAAAATQLQALLGDLQLSAAALAARRWDFGEAERLILRVLRNEPQNTRAMDLLARVYAQRGQYGDAERLLQRIIAVDPENAPAAAALRVVGRRRLGWWRFRLAGTAVLSFSAVLALVVFVVWELAQQGRVDQRSKVLGRVDQPVSVEQAKSPAGSSGAPPLELPAATPGVRWIRVGSSVLVTFDKELFTQGVTLADFAASSLLGVAEHLSPYAGKVSVTVLGCTDARKVRAESPFRDNFSLGLARAEAIIRLFRTEGQLAGTFFTAGSGTDSIPRGELFDASLNVAARTAVLRVDPVRSLVK